MTNTHFWWQFGRLFPVLVAQGWHTRRTALRLPEAQGATQGLITGCGEPQPVFVLGESTVAGVGVEHYQQGLAAQIAQALAQYTQQTVKWHSCGKNGAKIAELLPLIDHQALGQAAVIVISTGVNDTTGLTSLRQWQQQLRELVHYLRIYSHAPIFFLTLPPMQHFTALPQPLRRIVGMRARLLDQVMRRTVATLPHCVIVDYELPLNTEFLARDGYHPSALGYQRLGQIVAQHIKPHVHHTTTTSPFPLCL